jgi:hypothetical protein
MGNGGLPVLKPSGSIDTVDEGKFCVVESRLDWQEPKIPVENIVYIEIG